MARRREFDHDAGDKAVLEDIVEMILRTLERRR